MGVEINIRALALEIFDITELSLKSWQAKLNKWRNGRVEKYYLVTWTLGYIIISSYNRMS